MIPKLLEIRRDLLYRWRRKVATAAVVLLICTVAYHVIFGANGLMIYSKKRSEYKTLESEVDRLQHENQELSKEIHNLKTDPKAIEKAWPCLNSEDRFLRYAARIALEWQPVAQWKERALAETGVA